MRRWHLSFDLDFENESGMQRRFQAEGIPWGGLQVKSVRVCLARAQETRTLGYQDD